MSATAGTTTIEVPLPVKARLARLKDHPRQSYHEVIVRALDALEARASGELDPLVAKHRVALRTAAAKHGITRVWLFGSRARRDNRPDSDVDLLVQGASDAWELAGFLADATEILGTLVDVADLDGLSHARRGRILPEAVVI